MAELLVCPICKSDLTDVEDKDGVRKFFCTCAGVRRPVIEIHPPAHAPEAPARKSKKKEIDLS